MMQPKLKNLVRIGVDFDQTVCRSHYDGEHDKWVMGLPVTGAREALESLEKMGYKPWIYTSRPSHEEIEIREWLKRWGMIKFVHGVVSGKPLFLTMIDDRAIKFSDWDKALREVEKIGKSTT